MYFRISRCCEQHSKAPLMSRLYNQPTQADTAGSSFMQAMARPTAQVGAEGARGVCVGCSSGWSCACLRSLPSSLVAALGGFLWIDECAACQLLLAARVMSAALAVHSLWLLLSLLSCCLQQRLRMLGVCVTRGLGCLSVLCMQSASFLCMHALAAVRLCSLGSLLLCCLLQPLRCFDGCIQAIKAWESGRDGSDMPHTLASWGPQSLTTSRVAQGSPCRNEAEWQLEPR
jgi:hypothetical protein